MINSIAPSTQYSGFAKQLGKTLADRLQTVNFDDATAVKKLHKELANTSWVQKFCDWAIYNGDIARSRSDAATLQMHQVADERKQSPELIPGNRQEALKRLAQSITPTARTALLKSLDDRSVSNEFTELLALPDRHCVAAHMFVAEEQALDPQAKDALDASGKRARSEALLNEAANRFRSAGSYYSNRALRPALAIEAYTMAADVYRQRGDLSQVAESMQYVAVVLAKTARATDAADAFMVAADRFIDTAAFYRLKQDTDFTHFIEVYEGNAAKLFTAAAQYYEQDGRMEQAGDARMRAAERYLQSGGQVRWLLEENYLKAQEYYRLAGQPTKATTAEQKAAEVRRPGG